jgi:hypothetical protein
VKWLADDDRRGFRARLIKAPPGWSSANSQTPLWHKRANRFLYVVWGDLGIQRYDDAGTAGELVTAGADWFVHQPPRAVLSHGTGAATEGGAIWLEVTYAEGITAGGGPIEAPKTL